jgi:hypothetical protein
MRAGRWILLLLYLALVAGLFASVLADGEGWVWVVAGVTLTASGVFILGAGHKDLFRPIGRPRILFPVASAALMLSALLSGLTMALVELFEFQVEDDDSWAVAAFWGSLLATWIFWGVVLYIYTRRLPRYLAVHNMARLIFAGSIAELLATVPSHIIVSKRPGCLTGILTGMGLFAGLLVMIWSFGPAIFFLFLRESQRAKERGSVAKAITAPPAHKLPQYGLKTLMIAILLIAVACSLLRLFSGEWAIAVIAAWGILLSLVLLFLNRRWIMVAGFLGVFAGLIYTGFGEWQALLIVIPTGLLGIVLLKTVMFGSPGLPAAEACSDEPVE